MTAPPVEGVVAIERLAAGGDGVGRWADGRVVFVPRTAPSDRVRVAVTVDRPRYLRGEMRSLVEPGPDRIDPPCPHYHLDACGGCQLQHLPLPVQEQAKRGFVGDALRRIGGLEVDDPPIVPSQAAWHYRSKITLTRADHGFGFYRWTPASSTFALFQCPVAREPVNHLWAALGEALDLLPLSTDRLTLREASDGGLHLVAWTDPEAAWPGVAELAARLERDGAPVTLWQRTAAGRTVLVVGGEPRSGGPAFEQVNPVMGRVARQAALESLGSVAGRLVWDLYAGVGDASAVLADAGATVESVEIDPHAVRAARRRRPDDATIRRHVGSVERVVPRLGRPDLVVLNPPRTGVGKGVARALREAGPRRIVYLSCDPATLARDLRRLAGEYRVDHVQAFDLFPQTAHVETVVRLEKR